VTVPLGELVKRAEDGAASVINEDAANVFEVVLASVSAIISAHQRINRCGSVVTVATGAQAELHQPREALDALAGGLDCELRRATHRASSARRVFKHPFATLLLHPAAGHIGKKL
jgi:hypothetical protein